MRLVCVSQPTVLISFFIHVYFYRYNTLPHRHPAMLAKIAGGDSYQWVAEQRKVALNRAYLILKDADGNVCKGDWLDMMGFLQLGTKKQKDEKKTVR